MTCPSVSRMETTGQSTVSGIFVEMVEEFLDRTGTPPGVFGREAMGAPGFVRRLRGGCLTALQMLDQAVAFIEAWFPDEGGDFAFSGSGRLRGRLLRARRVRWVEREPEEAAPVRMLRLQMVLARTGFSKSTLVHLAGEEELRRERWSPTDRFDFLGAIPQELVVYDPMGLPIACLQADRPPVTGEER